MIISYVFIMGTPICIYVGIPSGMLVSDQACWSPIRHVGLQPGMLVSNQVCRSPMGLRQAMSISDGSPIRHVGHQQVPGHASWAPMGLQLDMLVFDGSSMSFQLVSDNNTIFVNFYLSKPNRTPFTYVLCIIETVFCRPGERPNDKKLDATLTK